MGPQKSAKHRFLGKFGSHNTIHTFKNYFAAMLSAICFQFGYHFNDTVEWVKEVYYIIM